MCVYVSNCQFNCNNYYYSCLIIHNKILILPSLDSDQFNCLIKFGVVYPCFAVIGLTHIGCYRLTRVKLKVFEAMTEELSDSAMTRSEPVRKCGTASLSHGNTYFSLAEGMCFSGSNQIADYTGDGESSLCSGGRGSYIGGQFVIDVYRIDDPIAFQESSAACLSCGKDFCSQTDLQSVWRLMCSVSSADQSLPNHFLLFSLVLVSSVLIVTVSLVN